MEKVAILIPVFNGEQTLAKCINSCLYQTYKNIEVVVVIDGGSDNSIGVATELKNRDKRIILVNKQNEGLPRARRVAFENSTGQLIYHLDQDDYIEPVTIELLVNRLKESNADIVVSGSVYETVEGKYITQWISNINGNTRSDYLDAIFQSKLQPNIWGKLIKRQIYSVIDVIEQYTGGEDYLANIMMICYNKTIKIISEPKLLHHYIVYKGSLTNMMPAEEFFDFTNKIEDILIKAQLEDQVLESWSYFRVKKCWLYYLRRGGKKYLEDDSFKKAFYKKYVTKVKKKLSFTEKFELWLFMYSQFLGFYFSKINSRLNKLVRNFSNSK